MKGINMLTKEEFIRISDIIRPTINNVSAKYDHKKYPSSDYNRFKASFASLRKDNTDISDALIWKWGHWGKNNFPQSHKDLIGEIQELWPYFVESKATYSSEQTFIWWSNKLIRSSRFITVSFITHLVHHNKLLPIIDQHNFRAMGSLISFVRPHIKFNKKPSQWGDIIDLKYFIASLLEIFHHLEYNKFDKYLMMYGKYYAKR